MGQRLVKCVAAASVVEGLDAQGHGGEPFSKAVGSTRSDTTPFAAGASRCRN